MNQLPLFTSPADDRAALCAWLDKQSGTTKAHTTCVHVDHEDGMGHTSYRVTPATKAEALARMQGERAA